MEIKEPVVSDRTFKFFTSIWIVPFIAFAIGGWLIYEHFSKLGPEITIKFENSGGLVAGQSVIKFRDVPVGKINKIEINNNGKGVIVYARINKDAEPFLNETTKFWIVKPEVDYSGVKGLDTLLNGSYINMYAKKGKESIYNFKGLNGQYVDINSGHYYVIQCDFPVKVKKTTPVFYKGIQIGEIDKVTLNTINKKLIIIARIYKEYGNMVNSSTRFWVQSLLDLKLNDNKLEVNMAPLPILLLGGIELDTDFSKKYDNGYNKIFNLYKSRADAKQRRVGTGKPHFERFAFKFKGNVSSLEEGMPIKYKGFNIGKIDKLKIYYNTVFKGFEAECLGLIDTSNFSTNGKDGFKNFKDLASSGIIAKLTKTNPLFNKSVIILEENNKTKVTFIKDKKLNAFIVPTQEYKASGIMAELSKVMEKLNSLNLQSSINNLNDVLKTSKNLIKTSKKVMENINKVIKTKEFRNLSKNLNGTLKNLNKTIIETRKVLRGYGSNSLFADKVESTLKELHDTSEQTNKLLHKLNKKPNALIFGE